jgi:hypothetical protein
MPLRALRPNRSERDLKRRSTLDPAGLFSKRTDKSSAHANDDTDYLTTARAAVSEDGGRPRSTDGGMPSPPIQESTPMTRRFSLMRFRHASDSQLSLKAKEQAVKEETPPVPAVPVESASQSASTTTPCIKVWDHC